MEHVLINVRPGFRIFSYKWIPKPTYSAEIWQGSVRFNQGQILSNPKYRREPKHRIYTWSSEGDWSTIRSHKSDWSMINHECKCTQDQTWIQWSDPHFGKDRTQFRCPTCDQYASVNTIPVQCRRLPEMHLVWASQCVKNMYCGKGKQ